MKELKLVRSQQNLIYKSIEQNTFFSFKDFAIPKIKNFIKVGDQIKIQYKKIRITPSN